MNALLLAGLAAGALSLSACAEISASTGIGTEAQTAIAIAVATEYFDVSTPQAALVASLVAAAAERNVITAEERAALEVSATRWVSECSAIAAGGDLVLLSDECDTFTYYVPAS